MPLEQRQGCHHAPWARRCQKESHLRPPKTRCAHAYVGAPYCHWVWFLVVFSSVSATIRASSTSRTSQASLPSHWVIAWSAAWCNSSASLDMLGVSSMGSLSGAWRARIIFSKVGYAEQPAATSSLPKATWKSCSRGFSRGAKPKARCSCMANKTRWWFPARWMVWIGNGSSPTKTSNPVTTATSGSSEDRRIVAPTMP